MRRPRSPRLLAGIAAAVVLSGCDGGSTTGVELSREDFVAAYVALRLAEAEASSPADFDTRKAEILERYGTSGEEMLAFIEAHAHDVAYMAALWDTVQTRIEAGAAAGAEAPESEGSGE